MLCSCQTPFNVVIMVGAKSSNWVGWPWICLITKQLPQPPTTHTDVVLQYTVSQVLGEWGPKYVCPFHANSLLPYIVCVWLGSLHQTKHSLTLSMPFMYNRDVYNVKQMKPWVYTVDGIQWYSKLRSAITPLLQSPVSTIKGCIGCSYTIEYR